VDEKAKYIISRLNRHDQTIRLYDVQQAIIAATEEDAKRIHSAYVSYICLPKG
jgi:hypothetical protein